MKYKLTLLFILLFKLATFAQEKSSGSSSSGSSSGKLRKPRNQRHHFGKSNEINTTGNGGGFFKGKYFRIMKGEGANFGTSRSSFVAPKENEGFSDRKHKYKKNKKKGIR